MCVGADLRTEEHFIEQEVGRVKESYNPVTDSMAGVYAGIVDGELKRNPSTDGGVTLDNGFSFWDLYTSAGLFWPSYKVWPTLVDNVYDTCTDASPHPYCKTAAGPEWTENFRNFPLHTQVPPAAVRRRCDLPCARCHRRRVE